MFRACGWYILDRPTRRCGIMRMLRMGVFLAAVQIAPAATWYVNGRTGRDSNNCTSATTACRTIGHAISLASSGDSISVAAGTYTENLTINVNLKLIGAHPATTIIDGGGVNRVVSILNASAQVGIAKVTIRHGVAAGGGGIYNSGTLAITNSTLSGNAANGFTGGGGGGIYNASGTVRISNSTFSGNTGSPSGGGIYNGGTVTLQNSIVANSTSGGNCYGTVSSAGYNLSSDGTCNFNNAGDLNNTDPLLGPLQNNGGPTQTMASLPGSPVIDAGNPNGCTDSQGHLLATDQRGQPRPDAGDASGCDMGAYENQTN